MRISALAIANGLAWAAFGLIFAATVVMADVLGFLGLFIIGAITWMVCVRAGQDDNPDWQTSARRISTAAAEQPEQRAARLSSWQAALPPHPLLRPVRHGADGGGRGRVLVAILGRGWRRMGIDAPGPAGYIAAPPHAACMPRWRNW